MSSLTDTRVLAPQRLAGVAERIVARSERRRRLLPAPQVLMRAPGWEFAHGDRGRRFHAASVGKAMTATLAMQLAAAGRLDLDAPITRLLAESEWTGLFTRAGVDQADRVTAWHLLTHTSGVADYFEDRNDRGARFPQLLLRDLDRRWEPSDLLAFTRDHQRPVAAAGARFHYSDTGYVLLGRIIEEVSGTSLGTALYDRIFAPSGMTESCLLFHTMPGGAPSTTEPGVDLDVSPIVVAGVDLARTGALSCDWGGGGVVTTLDDLLRFSDAFHAGRLVPPQLRARMMRFQARYRPGIRYGGGLMQLRYRGFTPFAGGLPRTVGHLGVTGVHLFAAPDSGVALAMNFHSTAEMIRSFRVHIQLLQAVMRSMRG